MEVKQPYNNFLYTPTYTHSPAFVVRVNWCQCFCWVQLIVPAGSLSKQMLAYSYAWITLKISHWLLHTHTHTDTLLCYRFGPSPFKFPCEHKVRNQILCAFIWFLYTKMGLLNGEEIILRNTKCVCSKTLKKVCVCVCKSERFGVSVAKRYQSLSQQNVQ